MSEILGHLSLEQIHSFTESFHKDVRSLILADKLRYLIPVRYVGPGISILDTHALPDKARKIIEQLVPSDDEGIFGQAVPEELMALGSVDLNHAAAEQIVSMPSPRSEPKYLFFRNSKIHTATSSGVNFVVEFETASGTPVSLWRKLLLDNKVSHRLSAITCGRFGQTTTNPFAGILVLGEFSIEELEHLTGQQIQISPQPITAREQLKTREQRSSLKLPEFKPTNNKVARTICLWANRFVAERSLEPDENDLWEFMWAHKDECGLEMSRSAGGVETYSLADADIDLADLRHRLSTYRVPFLGKK